MVEEISTFNPETGALLQTHEHYSVYPANIFVTTKDRTKSAIRQIQDDLVRQIDFSGRVANMPKRNGLKTGSTMIWR